MRGKLVTKGAKKGQYIEVKPQIQELELLKAKLQDNKEYTQEKAEKIEQQIEKLKEESFRLIDLRYIDILLGDTPTEGLLNAIMSIFESGQRERRLSIH